MWQARFIRPVEQPAGSFRLLDWLDQNFTSDSFHTFYCLSAFVKVKPFYKLHESIQRWKSAGKRLEAIVGIDHKGTSWQALRYLLENFDAARVLHVNYSTFHPKLYLFCGDHEAAAYYGSSNLTSGGLETNFEGGVLVRFQLPEEQDEFADLLACYTSLLSPGVPCMRLLTEDFLQDLYDSQLLLDEHDLRRSAARSGAVGAAPPLFAPFSVKPPKALRTGAATGVPAFARPASPGAGAGGATAGDGANAVPSLAVTGFVIQVNPHANGEIHLSKLALKQNGKFFGYPFSGVTAPKRSKNSAYPQRIPDPVVTIRVFDRRGVLVDTISNYNLNMVYYKKNEEIRVTITPALLNGLGFVPGSGEYPILVMRASQTDGCDYDMDFYAKGSADYEDYLAVCSQTLPSGGKPVARRMGWF